jgi:hypothetical protein
MDLLIFTICEVRGFYDQLPTRLLCDLVVQMRVRRLLQADGRERNVRASETNIKYDELTETKLDALAVTVTGKAKTSECAVVCAAGVFEAGGGHLARAAVVVDSSIEDYFKETVRQVCQAINIAG